MRVAWLGWSTFRVDVPDGPSLVLDPCVSPLLDDPHASLADLDGVDVMLLTHGHHEHIKDAARVHRHLERGGRTVPIVAPPQVREYLVAYRDIPRERFVAVAPDDEVEVAGVTVRARGFPHLPKHDVAGKLAILRRDNLLGAPAILLRHAPTIVRSWFAIKRQPEFGPFLAYDVEVAGRRLFFTCEAFTELLDPDEVDRWAQAGPPVDLALVGVESGQEDAASLLTDRLGALVSVACPVHAPFERFYGKDPVHGARWEAGRPDRGVWSPGASAVV